MKRPSLADTMKAVAAKSAPPPVPMKEAAEAAAKPAARPKAQKLEEGERKFFAATREGLKRITVAVAPDEHKRLKRLSVEAGRSIEDLMREALADLFAKHE